MQVIYPPSGLQSYPGQGFAPAMQQMGNTLSEFILMKNKIEKDKAAKKLELYLKSGEISGELDQPTPEIQKAFKTIYGQEPTGILKTGGKTLAGKKTEAEIANVQAITNKNKAMSSWYERRNDLKGVKSIDELNLTKKAWDAADKYANSKLGKPFEVLDDEERAQWQQYWEEGKNNFYSEMQSNKASLSENKANLNSADKEKMSVQQLGWMNRWNALSPMKKKQALTNPEIKAKIEAELASLGLSTSILE